MIAADRQALADRLKMHEGLRLRLYTDTVGKLTIGYGHNIESRGISLAIAEAILVEDLVVAEADAVAFLGVEAFSAIDGIRQQVLVELSLNMGLPVLRTFVGMRAALIERDYQKAAQRLRQSRWCTQVKAGRCGKLAGMLATGVVE